MSYFWGTSIVDNFTFKELSSELTKLESEDSTSDTFTFFVDPDSSFAYISLVYNEVSGLDFVNDYNNSIKDHFESMSDIDNQERLYNL